MPEQLSLKQEQQLKMYYKHSKLHKTPMGRALLLKFHLRKLQDVKTPHNCQ